MDAMQNRVLTYLQQLAPESKARVTAHFPIEVEEMSILLAKMMDALQRFHSAHQAVDLANPKQVAFGLMTKGANTLMAAFELSLSGYFWEPSVLLRSALEGFATAWDLVHNPPRFEMWRTKRKFESTDSITNVKQVSGEIGKLYGYLSRFNVHTSPLNSSPSMVMIGESPQFQFFGFVRPGKESIRKTEVLVSLFVAYICLQLTEITFYQYAPVLETIETVPGEDMVRTKVSERHRKIVASMTEHFSQLAAGDPIAF